MEVIHRVRAEIDLYALPAESPERKFRTGVRPNHVFDGREWTAIGVVEFEDRDELRFGESCVAKVSFVWPDTWQRLRPGSTWHLNEGPNTVGRGRVVEVLE